LKNATIYTIGIGTGCSDEFIEHVARLGNGQFELISDNEEMNVKIISLLKASLTPMLRDVALSYDQNIVEFLVPDPETLQFVKINEPLNFFVFLNKKFQNDKETTFVLSYENSNENRTIQETLVCKINDSMVTNNLIHKFGFYKLLTHLIKSMKKKTNLICLASKLKISNKIKRN